MMEQLSPVLVSKFPVSMADEGKIIHSSTLDFGQAACRMKGVWEVVETAFASQFKSMSTTNVYITSSAQRENASGIIIIALGIVPQHVVLDADDDPSC